MVIAGDHPTFKAWVGRLPFLGGVDVADALSQGIAPKNAVRTIGSLDIGTNAHHSGWSLNFEFHKISQVSYMHIISCTMSCTES